MSSEQQLFSFRESEDYNHVTLYSNVQFPESTPLGEGGQAEAWKGIFDTEIVCIKIFKGVELRKEYKKEIDILLQHSYNTAHKNVVRLLGVYEKGSSHDRRYGYVMEFMEGGSLHNLIHCEAPYTDEDCYKWILQATRGIEYLHNEKVLHRDVKPSNMLLDQGRKILKLSDFGSAKRLDHTQFTSTHITFLYSAPEILSDDDNPYTYAADVYSLGITVWEMFHRLKPFNGKPMQLYTDLQSGKRPAIANSLEPLLKDVIKRMWDNDEKERPTLFYLLDNFERLLSNCNSREIVCGTRSLEAHNAATDIPGSMVTHNAATDIPSSMVTHNAATDIPSSMVTHNAATDIPSSMVAHNAATDIPGSMVFRSVWWRLKQYLRQDLELSQADTCKWPSLDDRAKCITEKGFVLLQLQSPDYMTIKKSQSDRLTGKFGLNTIYLETGGECYVKHVTNEAERSRREYDLAMSSCDENIVEYFMSYLQTNVPGITKHHLVIKYFEMRTLDEVLFHTPGSDSQNRQPHEQISNAQKMSYISSAAQALEFCHRKHTIPFVHNNILPSSFVVDPSMRSIKLFGFHNVKMNGEQITEITKLEEIAFRAPETVRITAKEKLKNGHHSSADVYGFGTLCYSIIYEIPPYKNYYDSMKIKKESINWLRRKIAEKTPKDYPLYWEFVGKSTRQSVRSIMLDCLDKRASNRPNINKIIDQLQNFSSSFFRLRKGSSSNEIRQKKRYDLMTPIEDEISFNALPRILLSWCLPNIEENYEMKGDIEPVDPALSQDEQKLDYQKIRVRNRTGWTVLKKLHKDHIEKCWSSFSSNAPFAEKLLRSIAKVQHPYLLNFSRFIVCKNKNNERALKGIMTETLPRWISLKMLPKATWESIDPDVILKWTLGLCRAVESCHSDYQISNLGLSLEKVFVSNDFNDVKLDIFESPFKLHIWDKKGDEKSLAKIIEEISFIYENESSKSAPSILRSSITALTTSQDKSRLSHIVSMLDAENLKFPMISEDECEKLGDRYDYNGKVYPVRVKNRLGVFKRVPKNEKYAIRQKRVCIKMKHPSILNYWGFAYKEEEGLRKVTGLLMERLLLLRVDNQKEVKAVTLARFLEMRSVYLGNSKRIENWRVYQFALQLSDALMYCHENAGIIYRSLGPRSVLIYDHCNKLKLYDFTLSREPVLSGTRGLGASGFQAPEMMDTLDKDSYGYNVDCWSYAMMIFYIIRNGEEGESYSMIYPFNGAGYKAITRDDIEKMLRDMQESRNEWFCPLPRLADGTFDWTAKHFFEDELLCYLEMGPPNKDATVPNTVVPYQCPEGRYTVYNVMRRCLALDPNRRPSMAEIHAYLEKNPLPR